MRIVGIILTVVCTLALIYQGFTYVSRDKIVDAGPVQVTADRQHTVWIPPVLSAVGLAAGVALLLAGGRRSGV